MIGFTSTTFRPFKVDKVIELAISSDVRCIEWGGDIHVKDLDAAKYVKQKCDESGIRISSYGSYYHIGQNDPDEFTRICELTSAMNGESIRVWLGSKSSRKTSRDEFENIVADGKRIASIAANYGLKVSSECHNNTYNDTAETTLEFLQSADADNLYTYFQPLYRDFGYESLRLKKTFNKVLNVHISFSEMKRMQLLRKKDNDYVDKIISVLNENNFGGIVLLEYTLLNRPKEFLKDTGKLKKLVDEQ